MQRLNFFCQPFGNLGIPNHTRDFIRGMIANDIDVGVLPLFPKGNSPTVNYDLDKEFVKLIGKKTDFNAPAMSFWYPNTFDQVLGIYPKNIGYFIFEYTKFDSRTLRNLNDLDVVCTASRWGVEVLKSAGVRTKCVVVPGGVNSKKFFYNNDVAVPTNKFKFIHVGKIENRKSTLEIIGAFNIAFKNNPNVSLSLLIDNPHIKMTGEQFLNEHRSKFVDQVGLSKIHAYGNVEDITKFYKEHHCAVFASKAEGIGLPITETLACGVPVISSCNSGMSEYINNDIATLLGKGEQASIYDKYFFPNSGEAGTWEKISVDDLVEKMLWVYNNYGKAKEKAVRASEHMKNNYTWERAGKIFKEEALNG